MGVLTNLAFDRTITLQRPVADTSFTGAGSGTWADVATVPANVMEMLPSRGEQLANGLNIANRPARIRIRWRDDITGDMQVLYNGRAMQIMSGPVELGRREGLELMAQDTSTAGGRA